MLSKKFIKIEILYFILRILIISISLLGIFHPSANTFWGQFWFFTLQTNLFVIILMIFKIIFQITHIFKVNFNISYKPWIHYLEIFIAFYITITGFIFCFILVPVALATNTAFISSLSYRDIFLHIFVPFLTLIEYYSCDNKILLKNKSAFLFLIYPLVYCLLTFARAFFGGKPFPGGSQYPYFFIDPTFNNQGWLVVICYFILCLLAFYFLALIFIFINNKIINKKTTQN